MDYQRLRITVGVAGLRIKTGIKTLLRFAIVAVMLLAVYNILIPYAPIEGYSVVAPYYSLEPIPVSQDPYAVVHLEDVLILAAGYIVGWLI